MSSSNGSSAAGWPVLDRSPDSGGFVYFTPNKLVTTPAVRSFVLNAGATGRFNFGSNAANLAHSPGDKGLLMLHAENPVGTETTTLQLVP